jgi:type III restriction enzyme
MNETANYIKNRLSLREPLRKALDIVATLGDTLELKKDVDLSAELAKVKALYPTCTDFEREFPSLCFSIATGVGKTRLMGACIAYLYQKKKIRNFFVLAPNLTIYEKLIKDFGDPGNSKYVFQGISDFVTNRPVIITGENYAEQRLNLFSDKEIRINVFNVSKLNRDATPASKGKEKGKAPRIKRLSEYLGQSYWDYLTGLNDLVILMDEAHRYHADSATAAINDLRPVLGIELSATPVDEKGNTFKNVVYEYSLAQALTDGKYVKIPAVATRKNFLAKDKTDTEVEQLKLEDSINVHEDTKNELELYSRDNGVKRVKPFVLVVCKNTDHARLTKDYIESPNFFNGQYAGKVLQIDSSINDDAAQHLLNTVEDIDNPIEIVIHVEMLKEGWDVTNLYTICPLRKADSIKLVEQTIGRGLRLPYNGERTGTAKVDTLTLISHDNFDKVIEAAKDKNSIFNKVAIVELSSEDLGARTEVVTSMSKIEAETKKEEEQAQAITDVKAKEKAVRSIDAKKAILNALPKLSRMADINSTEDLMKPEAVEKAMEIITNDPAVANDLFASELITQAKEMYKQVVSGYKERTIDIPRFTLQRGEVKVWFENFDLDVSGFNFRVLEEEIIRKRLTEDIEDTIGVTQGAFSTDSPADQIISELVSHPEIYYGRDKVLLRKLAQTALTALRASLDDDSKRLTLIRQHKRIIADRIYTQMMSHFRSSEVEYTASEVRGFTEIFSPNYTKLRDDGYKDYRDVITPVNTIPKYIYRGFEKACHMEYKFDAKTEKDFAALLERDATVIKWLRPAKQQFNIYWSMESRMYEPDFIVETNDMIYMVETKAQKDITNEEVLLKKKAAIAYCERASEYTTRVGGKPWKYLLIQDNEVMGNMDLKGLMNRAR